MGLLNLVNHKLVIDPDVLGIPVMKKIWDRDKTEGKHVAYKELLFVFYVADYQSPYAKYPEEERYAKVSMDIMEAKWKIDKELKKLLDEYIEIQYKNLPSLRLLDSAREAVHRMSNWLKNVSYEGGETKPELIAKTLKEIGGIIDSLNKLEEKVKKEITTSTRARGGGSTGLYEES